MNGKSLTALMVSLLLPALVFSQTTIPGGPVSGSWVQAGSPYQVEGEITVPAGETLNIDPGVEVIFQGHYKLIVNGYLEANGTETDSILFTAADTSVGWHSIRFIDAPDSSHLSYCVVQYGKAIGLNEDGYGGGIHCETSNPVIRHCSIRLNWAQIYDGGISLEYDANPTISYCDIVQNSANAEGGIGCFSYCDPVIDHCTIAYNISNQHSGGIILDTYCSPLMTNCVIANNSANGANGGGFMITDNCHPVITDCEITDNLAISNGGGFRISNNSNPVITGCQIIGNTAGSNGGGISCHNADPVFENCTINNNNAGSYGGGFHLTNSAQAELLNCVIHDNTALLESGGLEINNGASPVIVNCTITDNEAVTQSGGAMTVYSASPEFTNTIVWGNLGNGGVNFITAPGAQFRYCCFYDNEGGDFVGDVPPNLGIITGVNINGDPCDDFSNIFEDPEFVYPEQNDYRLSWGSSCIDAGMGTDPDATIADMGAFYYDQSIPIRILVTPFDMPIEIPASGGSFDYYIQVTNIDPSALDVSAWCDVTLPNGTIYGPTLGPVALNLPGEFTLGRERTQAVPAGAPAGVYTYNAYATAGPDTSYDSFTFVKLGSDGCDALSGWFNTGESFDTEDSITLSAVPESHSLGQNYPNPFNPTTTITFALPDYSHVRLTVYDSLGRLVKTLVNGNRNAGIHELTFDAAELSSGLYLYRIMAGDFNAVGKMVLVK